MPSRYEMDKDLFDDMPIGGDHPAPAAAPKAVKPKLSAQERRDKQAADKRATSAQIGAATRQRTQWEASPQGQTRTKDIRDLVTEHHNNLLHERGMAPIQRTGMNRAQIYGAIGVTNEGHGHGDQQLPGFENPHSAPEPPRWEDLPASHRAKTEQNMRLAGTSIGKMKEDFGAQLDQAVWRAHTAGHSRSSTGEPVPFTAHFYGDHPSDAPEPLDRPKDMMRESRAHMAAKGIHVDPSVQVAVVGHTSPNLKFTQGERGNRSSPNIEAAESVIEQHEAGTPAHAVTSGKNRRGITNQTRPANARRAAKMMEHVDAGGSLATARNTPSSTNPAGSSQWGPKTGPFANSFDSSKPDFLVGDVHTFGGGMLPHLGTTKPIARNDQGLRSRQKAFVDDPRSDHELAAAHGERNVFRSDKSGREKGIEKMGTAAPPTMAPTLKGKKSTAHSAADFAARQAIAERGLGTSVRRPQASQWGEEQIQRKAASPKLDVPSHEDAYPSTNRHLVNPGQMKLF